MREIKFRAWDSNQRRWIKLMSHYETFWHNGELCTMQSYIVLSQFTGLFDKNGKEIYEGDIYNDLYNEPLVVTWCEKDCRWEGQSRGVLKGYLYKDYCPQYEVIGNIYENPELLEVNDETKK